MAIRKFRKVMKPFTIVISLVFLLSLAYGGYESFRSSRANKKAQEALELNGEIISKLDVERTKNELANQYSSLNGNQIDRSLIDIIAFNEVIDRNITLDLAKKLKIKVPSSEVDQEFRRAEEAIGDKEQFKRMLEYQGFSKDSYKEKIEENLLFTKTIESFSKEIVPTEAEIKEYYDTVVNNRNIDFETSKEQIIENIKAEEGLKRYLAALNIAKKEAKIKDIAPEYANLVETTLYEENGFSVTNLDLALQTISELLNKKADTKEKAEKLAKESIKKQINIANVAQEKGIIISEDLSTLKKLEEYQKKLIKKYRADIKPTEDHLKKYFSSNKSKYEIQASADVNFAFVNIKASKEDEEEAKKKAAKVLNEVNKDNFESYGKNLSREDGYLYENLGKFSKGMMVKEFEDAVSTAEANSIVKNVVKTQFGYHVIFVKESNSKEGNWEAEHILVIANPSQKTVDEKMEKISKIKEDINSGTVAFSDIQKLDEDIVQSILIKGVTPDGLIPNLAYSPELTREIFASPLNEVKIKINAPGVFIYQKVKEVKPEAANYSKARETVKNDYINERAAEYMKKLLF